MDQRPEDVRNVDGEGDAEDEDEMEDLEFFENVDDDEVELVSTSTDEGDVLEEVQPEEGPFNTQLSARHTYLGDNLEAVDGNLQIVEEETSTRVPICGHQMVVVPGQTVPLTVFMPSDVMQLKRVRDSTKTIGFVFQEAQLKRGGIGTTAVLQSYSVQTRQGYEMVKAILQGKQRFRIKSVTRLFDATQEADVVILRESPASHPLDGYLSPSLARVGAAGPLSGQGPRVVATPAVDASGRSFRFRIGAARPRHRLASRYVAAGLAPHPAFLYRQYDHMHLIESIRRLLTCWNASWVDSLPHQHLPVEFSYWLIQSMPVSEQIKFQLMSLDHYVQRLRACLSILKKSSDMVCEVCGCTVTSKQQLINISDEGSCKAYVNPGGVVHEMLTVQQVSNVRNTSSKHTEHSWYPGYAWTIIQCASCNCHLGWKFTATKKSMHPHKFWGITRKSVRPKFEDQNWRPVI